MMKDEMIGLFEALFNLDTIHEEYQYNDTQYVLDSLKKGDVITITISRKGNEDKKKFESWLQKVDGDLFAEVLDELGEVYDLQNMYASPKYKEVINKVQSKTKEVAARKIKELQALL